MSGVEPSSQFAPLESQWDSGPDTVPGPTQPPDLDPTRGESATPGRFASAGSAPPRQTDIVAQAKHGRSRTVLLSILLAAVVGAGMLVYRSQTDAPVAAQNESARDAAAAAPSAVKLDAQQPVATPTPAPLLAPPATTSAAATAIQPAASDALAAVLPQVVAPARRARASAPGKTGSASGEAQKQPSSDRSCTPSLAALALCKLE